MNSPAQVHGAALVIAIVTGLLVARVVFRRFFQDREELIECIGYAFMPNLISLFRGQWVEEWHKTLKLYLFVFLSLLAGGGAYCAVCALVSWW